MKDYMYIVYLEIHIFQDREEGSKVRMLFENWNKEQNQIFTATRSTFI